MTKSPSHADLSQITAAITRDSSRADVVLRRRGSAFLDRLAQRARQSVATLIFTAEAVLADGAAMPRECQSAGGSHGAHEGRRDPVSRSELDIWRSVYLRGKAVEAILTSDRMKPIKSRVANLNAGFVAAAERVTDAIGATRTPL